MTFHAQRASMIRMVAAILVASTALPLAGMADASDSIATTAARVGPAAATLVAQSSPSGQAMPVGDLAGWRQIFTDDFTTDVAGGQFPAAVSKKWGAYPTPWKDTSKKGTYSPKIVDVGGGVLTNHIHTEKAIPLVSALTPRLPGSNKYGVTYGRFAARFRSDPLPDYKVAWLLWPDSENKTRDGEIDFPEMDLDSTTVGAYVHRTDATSAGDQSWAKAKMDPTEWHTTVIEWSPSLLVFLLDGVEIGRKTDRIPHRAMHWVLQTETALGLKAPPPADVAGDVEIDWVAAWAYDPKAVGASVTSTSPDELGQGASWRTVKVNGTGLAAGATASVSGAGVTVKSLSVSSSTLATAMLSIDDDATPGPRDVKVVLANGRTTTCAQCFSVNAAPSVTSVTPASVTRGQPSSTVEIVGTGFGSDVELSVSGAGLSVGSVTRVDATHLTARVVATSTAATGPQTMTVTNADAGRSSTAAAITVRGAAVPGAPQGIAAVAALQSAQVSFSAPPTNGSTITSYTVSSTDVTGGRPGPTVTAPKSPVTVSGLTADHIYTFAVAAVNAVGPGPLSAASNAVTPTAATSVVSLSPSMLEQGRTWRTVKVTGSGYSEASSAVVHGGGVVVKSTELTSSTVLTLMISIDADAAVGDRDVTVTAADGDAVTCAGCFTVGAEPERADSLDLDEPSVVIDSHDEDARVAGVVTLTASAADPSGITSMKWYVDGDEIAYDGAGPDWSDPWDTSTLSDGTHSVFAKARDGAGNWGTSPTVHVVVDNS